MSDAIHKAMMGMLGAEPAGEPHTHTFTPPQEYFDNATYDCAASGHAWTAEDECWVCGAPYDGSPKVMSITFNGDGTVTIDFHQGGSVELVDDE